jgi:outer membrane receptor protein involved in Fe transport
MQLNKWTILGGVSLAAFCAANPALAQSANDQVSEEIVVTATGRSAAAQDVPIALTAVTADVIEQSSITDVRNLQQVVPSYRVATGQSNSAGTSIAIRGIGTGADNPGFESAVGVFIDGVYRSRSGVALTDLPTVERIEVLRGPQGTLFGRNTSAGALSVLTAEPEFEFGAYGRIEAGNFGFIRGNLGLTGPLTDTFAVRIEGNAQARDGVITDLNSQRDINDRNRWFVRGQALWDITPTTTLRVIADTSETDEECCTAVYKVKGTVGGAIDLLAGLRGVQGIPTPTSESFTGAFTPGRNYGENVEESGISAEFKTEVWGMNLTSISSYRDWTTNRNQDIDFNGTDRAYRDGYELSFETITQEYRLQGENGPLNWLVGAFYSNEVTNLSDTIRFGADGSRYADILAAANQTLLGLPTCSGFLPASLGNFAGTPTNPCLTLYSSLPGQTAATPTLFATVLGGNPATAPVAAIFGNGLRATGPQNGQGQQSELTETDSTSFSIFTHNEIAIGDRSDLTIGLRYNNDTKDLTANLNANGTGCAFLQNTTPLAPGVSINSIASGLSSNPATAALAQFFLFACNPVVNTVANGRYVDSRDEEAWSGIVSWKFEATEDLNVYATYSRGYKSGGFNMDRSAFAITPTSTVRPTTRDWQFEPEFTDNYEFGWKWSLPGRTTFNGALFYQNIEDYQINAFTGFNFRNFNASNVISRGLEIDLASRPTDWLSLNGGMLYNEAFFDGEQIIPQVTERIADGTPIAGASEYTFTGGVGVSFPIEGTQLGWTAYIDGRYQTEYRTQTLGRDALGRTDQDSFGIINARLGIGDVDGSWAMELWARNLADEYYIVGAFGVPEQTGNFAVYPGEPRMYGVTLKANF